MEVHDPYMELFNKGLKLVHKNPVKAINYFNKIKKTMEFKELYINLGVAYKELGRFEEATKALIKAADKDLEFSDHSKLDIYPLALSNLGLMAYINEQDEDAIRLYQAALSGESDQITLDTTKFNYSLAKLRRYCSNKDTELDLCWKLYDYRFKRNGASPLKLNRKDLVMWDFKTKVDTILVAAEQGHGDTFMFGRYLKYLEEYADNIIVQAILPNYEGIFKYDTFKNASENEHTWVVPIGSLGRLVNHIPAGDWLSHLYKPKEVNGRLKIACVWQGNKNHKNDINRSTDSKYFLELSDMADLYHIGNKQKGFIQLGPSERWIDTIKHLEEVDLVITIDSAMAHLCGALGKPCWVLMPLIDSDFRWGDSSIGHHNIWYDCVSVIRNDNNWKTVFEEIRRELQPWVQVST